MFVFNSKYLQQRKNHKKTSAATLKLLVSISEINEHLGGVERKSLPLIIMFYSLVYFVRKSLEE